MDQNVWDDEDKNNNKNNNNNIQAWNECLESEKCRDCKTVQFKVDLYNVTLHDIEMFEYPSPLCLLCYNKYIQFTDDWQWNAIRHFPQLKLDRSLEHDLNNGDCCIIGCNNQPVVFYTVGKYIFDMVLQGVCVRHITKFNKVISYEKTNLKQRLKVFQLLKTNAWHYNHFYHLFRVYRKGMLKLNL